MSKQQIYWLKTWLQTAGNHGDGRSSAQLKIDWQPDAVTLLAENGDVISADTFVSPEENDIRF